MKLAEALIMRADLHKRIAQVKRRLVENVRVQEGDDPPFQPEALLAELDGMYNTYERLIRQINATNIQTVFDGDVTLTDALAERDVLAMRRNTYQEAMKAAVVRQDRFMRTELRYQTTIDLVEYQQRYDELARRYRQLDTRIQELNWGTELIE